MSRQHPGGTRTKTARHQPKKLAAWLDLIEAHLHDGQLQDALAAVHEAIKVIGAQPGLLQLAQQLEQAQRDSAALPPWQHELDHLTAINDAGNPAAALPLAEAFVQRWPQEPQGFQRLAEIRHTLGDVPGALEAARHSVALNPSSARAQVNLAVLLKASDDLDAAEACLHQALALNPDLDVAHATLGSLLRARGELQAAATIYQRALALNPQQAQTHCNFAHVLEDLGESEAAEQSYREALRLDPGFAAAANRLGLLRRAAGDYEQARLAFEQAIAADPTFTQAHIELGYLLLSQRRYPEALAALDQALELNPDAVMAHLYRARVLMELGELEASEVAFERALQAAPENNGWLRSSMLVAMAYCGHWPPDKLREAAEHWESTAVPTEDQQLARARVLQRAPGAGRKLRLGFLSNELRVHPVSFFLRAWLNELDRRRFEVYFYSSDGVEDDYTKILQELADHWESLAELSDAQAAERLLDDQLDILIDTSGHEPGHRLGVIARRVAPVQCHYIGYYATTGVSQMDYFIGDPVLIPPEHDTHFTEQVWRLPRTRYVYDPLESAPEPRWWPDPGGWIWVGSFNNLWKVRDASLELWAQVLHALPEAHLALKDFKGDNHPLQQRILNTLKACGIAADRVAFLKATPSWSQHMAYYNRLDIALDTLPFNSATTGFDALWMGCPLVTRISDSLAGRQAASALTGLGRREWIARDDAEFVRIAVELARDIDGRRHIRETQREQMRRSELCDGPGLARALETTFETMFERWQQSSARIKG